MSSGNTEYNVGSLLPSMFYTAVRLQTLLKPWGLCYSCIRSSCAHPSVGGSIYNVSNCDFSVLDLSQ